MNEGADEKGTMEMEFDENNLSADHLALNTHSPLMVFHLWFMGVHGYASVTVCVFGIFTNIFNITVLVRRDMRTPTNVLLLWLAVSDILTMVPYIPFAINFYCPPSVPLDAPERFSYGWLLYMLVMINVVATTHTISIWIGVSLAAFRFVQIKSTTRGPLAKERRIKQAKVITFLVYALSSLIMIPNYMTNELQADGTAINNQTYYKIKDLRLATNETEDITLANVITYALVAKIIPCLLILVFSGSLLYHMSIKGKSRRRRLATASCSKSSKYKKQATTTRMLLVVIILFLITELPQGILILLSTRVPGFYYNVYYPLGDLMDFIALVNNSINFVLYCIMSHQFRSRFVHMYYRRRAKLKSVSESMTSEKLTLREQPTRTTGAE